MKPNICRGFTVTFTAMTLIAVADTTISVPEASATLSSIPERKTDSTLPKVHYTNQTKVTKDCPIHWNYPHEGVNDQTWPAGPSTGSKIVGVRYTTAHYALVRDGQRQRAQTAPWWGWIEKDCLLDKVARKFPRVERPRDRANQPDPEDYAPRLDDWWATGGNNIPKRVDITPSHRPIKGQVSVSTAGTIRNGPNKFAIGNVGPGWTFQIARSQCRRLNGRPYKPSQWIFGYSPDARRWGWVQATHLPACTS
ncbi:hypothetical protein [Nonomuraea fuscirosea]|uniref:hypothetical protein n=1 Tax=Nonomuraea fuscirosea TaxID=1291556 RepID=UPI0033D178EA